MEPASSASASSADPGECSLEKLIEYASIPLNVELRKPTSASAGGGGGGPSTTILARLPPSSVLNRAEQWALRTIEGYMDNETSQFALAKKLLQSSNHTRYSVRHGTYRPVDAVEWKTDRNWANLYMYKVCTFFYHKQSGTIKLPRKYGKNTRYNTIHANHNVLPKDFVLAIIISTLFNLYKISDPALDMSTSPGPLIKITVDLYFNRSVFYSLGFHKDSNTSLDVVQDARSTPEGGTELEELELLNYVSLLFLSKAPILRGTAFMQTIPPKIAGLLRSTRTACTTGIVPLSTVIFNDRLLQHATPHSKILEVSETLYHRHPQDEAAGFGYQFIKRWDDPEQIILRRQEEEERLTYPKKGSETWEILKHYIPKPFAHILKNKHTFAPELKAGLEAAFETPRAFLRGHYSFEPFNKSAQPDRSSFTDEPTTNLRDFVEEMIGEGFTGGDASDKGDILGGIGAMLSSGPINTEIESFYINSPEEIDKAFKKLSETIVALGRTRKNKKTKRNKYKRKKTKTKRRR